MTLKAIPNLDDLWRDSARVPDVPLEAIPALRGKLKELDVRLEMRQQAAGNHEEAQHSEGDRLLAVHEAASRLGMKAATLYRRHKTDPAIRALVVDNGTRKLLFSPQKIEAFLRRRTGR